MTLNDLELPKYGFLVNLSLFQAATHTLIRVKFSPKLLEIQDDLQRTKLN